MILTRTPLRVSLFGGGTDYPAWYQKYGGAVLGMAINKYTYVGVKRMPPGQLMEVSAGGPLAPIKFRVQYSKVDDCFKVDQIRHPAVRAAVRYYGLEHESLEFHCFGDLPGRSGLGGSSSFVVGLIHAIRRLISSSRRIDPWQLADEAISLEQDVIKETVGCQDQVFSAHGGLDLIQFSSDGSRSVQRLDLPRAQLDALEDSLILAYTGTMRDAHSMAQRAIESMAHKETIVGRMKNMAHEGTASLLQGAPLSQIGHMLHEAWELKKKHYADVTSPAIDELYNRGCQLGAIGGKLLGAGGGGYLLFFVPIHRKTHFLRNIGVETVSFRISHPGSHTLVTEDQ